MNKLLVTLSFLISLICFTSQSWALPPCPTSGYKHNCYGTYTFSNENKYVGEYKDNKQHGQGTFSWTDGGEYIGKWKNGKMHGQAINTAQNGNIYIGEFKDNKFNGQGTFTYGYKTKWAGDKYAGGYKDGKLNGQGTYTWANGDYYVGEWRDDKKHGQGKNTWANGDYYLGEYKNNKRHGQGAYNYADGKVKEGIWEDGKFMYIKKLISPSNPKIEKYKSFCSEIGFVPGTDKFNECLLVYKNKISPNIKSSVTSESKIEGYKNFCREIGLISGTDKFNECLLVYKDKISPNIKSSITSESKIEGYKNFCREIGLISGTDKFNECLLVYENKISPNINSNFTNHFSNSDNKEIVFSGSGTGFAISSNGYLVTNHHVIDGCHTIKIHNKDKIIPATMINIDPRNDVALLKGNFIPNRILPFSNKKTELLQDIYVAGYPFGNKVSTSVKVTKGIISALTGVGNNFSNFQIDAALQPGNSGGPILNNKGNVIGIAVAKLGIKYIKNNFGVVPENTNFGIKVSVVKRIIDSENIELPNPNEKKISITKLGKDISESTYYLSCWKTK
jgi:hypothetical protein